MTATPYFGALLAIIAWGTFTVPSKAPSIVSCDLHPLWFQLYVSVGVSLSSLLLIPFQKGCISDFTPFGTISALMWVFANTSAMAGVKLLGIATAQSTWAGVIAIVSFVSSLVFFKDDPLNMPLAIVGVVLLCGGIAILAYVSSRSSDPTSSSSPPLPTSSSPGETTDALLSNLLDDAPHDPPKLSSPLKSSSLLPGFACVTFTGLMAGAIFVPLRLAPSRYRDGLQSIKFSFSQGISTLPAALLLVPLLFRLLYQLDSKARRAKLSFLAWLPLPHFRSCLIPGVISGALWNTGNLGATLSVLPPLTAVGYTLTQSALLVGCLWGILYFKEIRGKDNLLLFGLGAAVTMGGLLLTGYYGTC